MTAETAEDRDKIIEIISDENPSCFVQFPFNFSKETDVSYEYFDDRLYIDGELTFETMAKITDYLRKRRRKIEL